jgi:hypothetical protein
MSAELLRRAAAKMRETANAATSSPWGRASTDGQGVAVHHGAHDTVCLYADRPDAEHIVSWHPDVALAVADLLDNAAEDQELLAVYGELGPVHDTIMRRLAHQKAVHLARVYLGDDA